MYVSANFFSKDSLKPKTPEAHPAYFISVTHGPTPAKSYLVGSDELTNFEGNQPTDPAAAEAFVLKLLDEHLTFMTEAADAFQFNRNRDGVKELGFTNLDLGDEKLPDQIRNKELCFYVECYFLPDSRVVLEPDFNAGQFLEGFEQKGEVSFFQEQPAGAAALDEPKIASAVSRDKFGSFADGLNFSIEEEADQGMGSDESLLLHETHHPVEKEIPSSSAAGPATPESGLGTPISGAGTPINGTRTPTGTSYNRSLFSPISADRPEESKHSPLRPGPGASERS